jgi:hypothetical protein
VTNAWTKSGEDEYWSEKKWPLMTAPLDWIKRQATWKTLQDSIEKKKTSTRDDNERDDRE